MHIMCLNQRWISISLKILRWTLTIHSRMRLKKNLNMGISVLRDFKSGRDGVTAILGEYFVDPVLGRGVRIYYGSFMSVMGDAPHAMFREEIIRTVRHELRHHMEISAGVNYLGDEDRERMVRIRKRFGLLPSDDQIRAKILNRIFTAVAFLVGLLLIIYIFVLRYV